ncbi:hypothetical protein [Photobacterium kishitanii]|nr:hypothetical protein [Photobacterium kishitanii]
MYRGQLYEGARDSSIGDGNFVFGNGTYLTSHFGDASTYAAADTMINTDLPGNISRIAELNDIDYTTAKESILSKGDGQVVTAVITSKRLMHFGKEGLFDGKAISDNPELFERRLSLAMVESDVPPSVREHLIKATKKYNNDPAKLLMLYKSNGGSEILKNFASICNCDAFRLDSSISPVGSTYKGFDINHVVVLNDSCIENIRTDAPIFIDPCIYFPSFKGDASLLKLEHMSDCEEKMSNIMSELNQVNSKPVHIINELASKIKRVA